MIGGLDAALGGRGGAHEELLASHRFLVKLDAGDWDLGTWSRVTGLSVKWQKISYRYGESNKDHVFAGNVSLEPIKLSRAACKDSKKVQKWLVTTTQHRRVFTGSIELRDFMGDPVVEWPLRGLFPIGWSISEIDASAGKPMIETLELAHSGFLDDQAKVKGP